MTMKRLMKKMCAGLLATMLVVSAAACGKDDGAKAPAQTGKTTEAANPGESGAVGTEGNGENGTSQSGNGDMQGSGSADLSGQDPVTLTMVLLTDGADYADTKAVDQTVSDICEVALNTKLNIERVSLWDYATTMNLKLSSGEPCDLFQGWMNYNTYATNGYFLDLEPYKEYMPDILELIGDYVQMGYTGGHLYSVTAVKDLANLQGFILRKDWVEETGIDLTTVDTYEKFGDLLRAMKKNHPDATPLTSGTTGTAPYGLPTLVEMEGGGFRMAEQLSNGVGLMDPVNSSEVSNLFKSESFKRGIEFCYEWAKEGLIAKSDISSGAELVRAGQSGGYAMPYKPGVDIQEKTNCDTEMVLWIPPMDEALATTNNGYAWSVNANCEYPERAVQLLNYLYTSEECMNLLSWGIEEKDYVFVDKEKGIIDYPEGVDSSTVNYSLWSKFGVPNTYLQYLLNGSDPEQWVQMDAFNSGAKPSKAFGFAFDESPVASQVAAVKNVTDEYVTALGSGLMDPAEKYEEFLQRLEDAKIQDIIDEAQRQLDAWMSSK